MSVIPKMKRPNRPIALTIAGSDSGGGAGIQADLATWGALGVHGTTAITCLTAQNPREVAAVQAVKAAFLTQQLETVACELPPQAIKTGMLYSAVLIRRVADWYESLGQKRPPLVVDPVMVSTSGADLLLPAAVRVLTERLIPLAALMTPNLDEASRLLGHPITKATELFPAAFELFMRWGRPVLLKGGHLPSAKQAVDVFFDGENELELSAPWVRGVNTHGTGCTYSAAIAGYLALGLELPVAVEQAKQHITQAIAQSVRIGNYTNLNPFWTEL